MKLYYLFFCLMIARLLSASPFIWATDQVNNRVLVIDAATNTIFQTIPQSTGLFDTPYAIAITPNNLFAYVVNAANNSVSVINTATYQLEAFIPVGGISSTKWNIAISPNGAFAYVINTHAGTVDIIDTATNSLVGLPITGFSEPTAVAFSSDSAFAYVTDYATTLGASQVYRINTATLVKDAPFTSSSFKHPESIAITGTTAYVPNFGNGITPAFVLVLNLANPSAVPISITLPNLLLSPADPESIVLSPNGSTAYVTDFTNNRIFVINTSTNTITATINSSQDLSSPIELAIAPSGNILYVANSGGPIATINTGTNTLISTIPNTSVIGYLAVQQSSARQFAKPSNRKS